MVSQEVISPTFSQNNRQSGSILFALARYLTKILRWYAISCFGFSAWRRFFQTFLDLSHFSRKSPFMILSRYSRISWGAKNEELSDVLLLLKNIFNQPRILPCIFPTFQLLRMLPWNHSRPRHWSLPFIDPIIGNSIWTTLSIFGIMVGIHCRLPWTSQLSTQQNHSSFPFLDVRVTSSPSRRLTHYINRTATHANYTVFFYMIYTSKWSDIIERCSKNNST